MKKFLIVPLTLVLFVPVVVGAQGGPSFGPFSAIKMDRAVVEDVLAQDNDIYVKVTKDYWNKDFVVKISNEDMAYYRTWFNGQPEMSAKVYRSQQHNLQGYTYRINTAARFIEYWVDGNLVLHLERRK
ncbi:MAG: hypothetical protein KKE57_10285 [Proteobacteria bacterium]|nr:hypothetical protein [Pseudomonadota bacterium]